MHRSIYRRLTPVFIPRCGRSVAAAVGESRHLKKYLHAQFQSLSACEPLEGLARLLL